MTDRELDVEVALVLGWKHHHYGNGPDQMQPPDSPVRDGIEQVRIIPRYSTDPAAAAEVKRWLLNQEDVSGIEITVDIRESPQVEVWVYEEGKSKMGSVVSEVPIDGDPILAECRCLAKAALAVAGKAEAKGAEFGEML